MKTIIAGSRDICHTSNFIRKAIFHYLDQFKEWEITEVVSGTANGPDIIGELWAQKNFLPYRQFPAQWAKYGNKAGPLRNQDMADYADACICFWDGESRGTQDMMIRARVNNLIFHEVQVGLSLNGKQFK
jgi:hypothetical protein